ncbi:hypothetical protein EW146_g5280 [Bondarzewia mesenterica]|uniref:C2H2-type domain-containing protein n=1 Tax=Bondarzewia mesenterica TaxID=1095465 RepID=A0A4S4LRY3_9AGAM|nr:hypothetical protein EW146_g5280 [Bondarzewia mesenterica]
MSFLNMPSDDYDRRAQYIVSREPNGSVQTYCRWDGDGDTYRHTYRHIHRIPHPSQLSKESTLYGALGDEYPLTLAAVERASAASIAGIAPLPWVVTLSRARLIPLSTAAVTSLTEDNAVQPLIAPPYATIETSSAIATPLNLAEDQPMMDAPPITTGAYPMAANTSPTTVMSSSSDTVASLRYRPPEVMSRPASHLCISLQMVVITESGEGGRTDDDSIAVSGRDYVVQDWFTQEQVHKTNNQKSPDDIFEQDVPEAVMGTISSSALGLGRIDTIPGHSESENQDPIQVLSSPSLTPSPQAPPPVPLQTQQITILEVQPPQTVEEMAEAYPYRYCLECKILYSTKFALKRHLEETRIHDAVEEFWCKWCNKGFLREYTMAAHMDRCRRRGGGQP